MHGLGQGTVDPWSRSSLQTSPTALTRLGCARVVAYFRRSGPFNGPKGREVDPVKRHPIHPSPLNSGTTQKAPGDPATDTVDRVSKVSSIQEARLGIAAWIFGESRGENLILISPIDFHRNSLDPFKARHHFTLLPEAVNRSTTLGFKTPVNELPTSKSPAPSVGEHYRTRSCARRAFSRVTCLRSLLTL